MNEEIARQWIHKARNDLLFPDKPPGQYGLWDI